MQDFLVVLKITSLYKMSVNEDLSLTFLKVSLLKK